MFQTRTLYPVPAPQFSISVLAFIPLALVLGILTGIIQAAI